MEKKITTRVGDELFVKLSILKAQHQVSWLEILVLGAKVLDPKFKEGK